MRGDETPHLLGRPALGRHQNDIGAFQRDVRDRLDCKCRLVQAPVSLLQIGDAQSAPPQSLFDARTRQQRHLASRQGQATSDIATDAAGARYNNGCIAHCHRNLQAS